MELGGLVLPVPVEPDPVAAEPVLVPEPVAPTLVEGPEPAETPDASVLAWANPDPVSRAAPRPTVTAPVPSHPETCR